MKHCEFCNVELKFWNHGQFKTQLCDECVILWNATIRTLKEEKEEAEKLKEEKERNDDIKRMKKFIAQKGG